MTRYTRNAKEVLRDGKHFADCIDDGAARLIADALNERKGMSTAQKDLPLGDNGPLFDDPPVDGMLYGGPYQGTLIVPEHIGNLTEMIEREKLAIRNIGISMHLENDVEIVYATGDADPLAHLPADRRYFPIRELPTFHRDEIKPIKGVMHHIRQENDEYACACGVRWDIADGEDHP